MRLSILLFCALCAVMLAACGPATPTNQLRAAPAVIHDQNVLYVPIPADKTANVPIEQPHDGDGSLKEARRVAHARAQSLLQCNSQLNEIHAVQGTPAGKGPC